MPVIIWFILSAFASSMAIRELTTGYSSAVRKTLTALDLLISIAAVYLIIRFLMLRGEEDTPAGIMAGMQYNLAVLAIILPRTLFAFLHYTGRLIRIKRRGRIQLLSAAGATIWAVLFLTLLQGYLIGRFDFRYEKVGIAIPGLHPDLEGLRIVHLSDLHLGSFHGSAKKMSRIAERVNELQPDIIINTGDFITLGHREYGRFDTILVKMASEYGNYAVLGNHDIGTYLTDSDEHKVETAIRNVSELVRNSGYTILDQSNRLIKIGRATLAVAGVETRGRHPVMVHPDAGMALQGTDNADLRILLSHDPNHWDRIRAGDPKVELTLSGHTHGMQFGILWGGIKWSPAQYSYPRWQGLYREGNMQLYVNRGLGVLGIPVRVGMPPEITIITLIRE